ncbi:unnamed protein product [Orchesella dallaii]|uniref:Uncharacterized protein n=1 Tax=Orchesella dallaii TaxID=48710 RepID=A0ABP1RV45_9HEXA
MRPSTPAHISGPYIVVAFAIWSMLVCGLEATIWSAFYNNPEGHTYPYILFGFYLGFGLVLFYLTGPELCARLKQTATKSSTLNWLFVLCIIVTFGVFFMLFKHYYNIGGNVIDEDTTHMLNKTYHFSVLIMILFPTFYMVCSFASVEQLPFLIFIVLIQLGTGLAVTVPFAFRFGNKENPHWMILIYVIFAVEFLVALRLIWFTVQEICSHQKRNVSSLMVILYWTCRFCTVMTGLLFVALGTYIGSPLSKGSNYAYAFAIYFYSCYFLVLLELIAKTPGEEGTREIYRTDTSYLGQDTGYELGVV